MESGDKNFKLVKNIKVIEWLKSELLTTVASLHELLVKGKKNNKIVEDILANIILVSFLIGSRLGVSFKSIDSKLKQKIKIGIADNHKLEKWYGDLSRLYDYIERTRK